MRHVLAGWILLAVLESGAASAGRAGLEASSPAVTVRIAAPCGSGTIREPHWKHVLWIWMENASFDEIVGSSSAPYLNRLAMQCGLATSYTGITHPSLPNYIAATSGRKKSIATFLRRARR